MNARHAYLLDDLGRRVVDLGAAFAVIELTGDERSVEVPLDVAQRQHCVFGLVVVARNTVPDDKLDAVLDAFGQHIVTGGILCLIGWTSSELPIVPPADGWRGVDGRLWAPLVIEGTLLAWTCLGVTADAA